MTLVLSEAQVEALARYAQDVLAYNQKTNLTAENTLQGIIDRHLADGLACVSLLKELCPQPNPEIADVGAGGGFIGVAVAIAWPEARVTLIEPLDRKFRFLNTLRIPGMRILKRNAGPEHHGKFDAVTARALAPLPEAIAIALPLAREGGHLVAYQSQAPDPQEPALKKALAKAGGRFIKSQAYRLVGETDERQLAVFQRCNS